MKITNLLSKIYKNARIKRKQKIYKTEISATVCVKEAPIPFIKDLEARMSVDTWSQLKIFNKSASSLVSVFIL